MLPHVGGKKFDTGAFLRLGIVNEYRAFPLPSTPAIEQARKDIEAEREYHERRLRGEQIAS
jgi:hypothetical protein